VTTSWPWPTHSRTASSSSSLAASANRWSHPASVVRRSLIDGSLTSTLILVFAASRDCRDRAGHRGRLAKIASTGEKRFHRPRQEGDRRPSRKFTHSGRHYLGLCLLWLRCRVPSMPQRTGVNGQSNGQGHSALDGSRGSIPAT
jgi:hypothetical protein